MKIKPHAQAAKAETTKSAVKAPVASAAAPKEAAKAHRVLFSLHTEAGRKVFVAGNFNDWDPTAKEMTDKNMDGNYSATLLLGPGKYQYKFIVDGTWCVDPKCDETIQNEHGTLNSVKHVL